MKKRGYTLVEVTLVIAISALLFMAFLASISGTLAARRYNDSIQSFAEFLRRQYSQAINVESTGTGATNRAIYGRIITFGEGTSSDSTAIYSYDIVGAAVESYRIVSHNPFTGDIAANIATKNLGTNVCSAANQEYFEPTQGAWLEITDNTALNRHFRGTLFIIRSPLNNSVTTKFTTTVLQVQQLLVADCNLDTVRTEINRVYNLTTAYANSAVDFCIASDDQPEGNDLRDIRVLINGSSSAAVQIIDQDGADNQCVR